MTNSRPSREQLLPGVKRSGVIPPNHAVAFHDEVARARARANRKDLVDVLLLLLVDLLFVSWEQATVPFLTRDVTVSLLLLLHGGYAISVFRNRLLPSMFARRVSATWSTTERQRVRV